MHSIHEFAGDRFDKLLAWARYLYWSELHRLHIDEWAETHKAEMEDEHDWHLIALTSAFYSSVWVVIEGWQSIPLADSVIDRVLTASPKYLHLLKRYRNGVFHYQTELTDDRFIAFLHEGETALHWVYLIHMEFRRYYWELIRNINAPESFKNEIQTSFRSLIGWIPEGIVEDNIANLRIQSEKAITMLQEAGDFKSPAAVDLVQASQQSLDSATQIENSYYVWKSRLIEQIEKEGGSGNA